VCAARPWSVCAGREQGLQGDGVGAREGRQVWGTAAAVTPSTTLSSLNPREELDARAVVGRPEVVAEQPVSHKAEDALGCIWVACVCTGSRRQRRHVDSVIVGLLGYIAAPDSRDGILQILVRSELLVEAEVVALYVHSKRTVCSKGLTQAHPLGPRHAPRLCPGCGLRAPRRPTSRNCQEREVTHSRKFCPFLL
jgi:hypothetical protein